MVQVITQNRPQIQERVGIIEDVFSVIQAGSGKVRTLDLYRIFENRQDVRFAITKLTCSGRISRKRGLGTSGVEYFYHDHASESFSKYRKTKTDEVCSYFVSSLL